MQIFENIRLAMTSLLANKMRSLLTMLGIIIGIASVIAIVTVGDAITGNVNEQMASFGGSNVTVGVQQKKSTMAASDSSSSSPAADYNYYSNMEQPTSDDYITPAMLADYEKVFAKHIQAISLSDDAGGDTLTNGHHTAQVSITGVNAGYSSVQKLKLVAGRWLRQSDIDDKRRLVLVSDKFVDSYWGKMVADADVVGKFILPQINGQTTKLYVAGVYHMSDSGMYSYDSGTSNLYIPITLAKELAGKTAGYSSITIQPVTGEDGQTFLRNTNTFFASYYLQNPKFTAVASSNEQYMKSINKTMGTLKLGIGAIAAISLLVGGIGVMNIMMVSVTERTREIGIRMALGAKSRVILFQFIVEAMLICLVGGAIGVGVGLTLGSIGASLMKFKAHASVPVILFAVNFSMAIGLFFGYYPAKKAARLNPIDALRYE